MAWRSAELSSTVVCCCSFFLSTKIKGLIKMSERNSVGIQFLFLVFPSLNAFYLSGNENPTSRTVTATRPNSSCPSWSSRRTSLYRETMSDWLNENPTTEEPNVLRSALSWSLWKQFPRLNLQPLNLSVCMLNLTRLKHCRPVNDLTTGGGRSIYLHTVCTQLNWKH